MPCHDAGSTLSKLINAVSLHCKKQRKIEDKEAERTWMFSVAERQRGRLWKAAFLLKAFLLKAFLLEARQPNALYRYSCLAHNLLEWLAHAHLDVPLLATNLAQTEKARQVRRAFLFYVLFSPLKVGAFETQALDDVAVSVTSAKYFPRLFCRRLDFISLDMYVSGEAIRVRDCWV